MTKWQVLLNELHGFGRTQAEICRATGIDQSAMSQYASGALKSPGWECGNKLVEFHRDERRKARRRANK